MNNQFQYALNGIIFNESLQKSVIDLIENIDQRISLMTDTLDYMNCIVKAEDDRSGGYLSQIIRGENMCRVRKPFFTSNDNLIPFNNEIDKRRIQDGSHDFYLIKRQIQRLCNEKRQEILKLAIGKNMYDIEHARLIRSKDKCAVKELKVLKSSSLLELAEKCNKDMMDKIDWMTISSQDMNDSINHIDCKRLWERLFNPEFNYSKWSESDCTFLLKLTSEYGCQGKWVQIASNMPSKRQPFICFKKWLELTSKTETSDEWNSEEDEQLSAIVEKMKDIQSIINWNKVAQLVQNRSTKDCEKRWNSLQLSINNRPFTDEEDYKLLLHIKKMGTERWLNIAREMDRRTADQCQQRYCTIVEELHPWSYFEDRRLWLVLRSYFRTLWSSNTQYVEPTLNINIYKSVIKGFNGRCPIVLRHRYNTLGKWFHIWNRFYHSVGVKESTDPEIVSDTTLLSDSCEQKTIVISRILKIILQTTFFDRIRNALYLVGSKNPDSDANELIIQCKNGDSKLLNLLIKQSPDKKLLNLLMFIIDLQNGIFIPTKFDEFINRSFIGFKYPQKGKNYVRVIMGNVRSFESKVAVQTTLRSSLTDLLHDEKISERDKRYIEQLLDCEGLFSSALNFATKAFNKLDTFIFSSKINLLDKSLPEIIRLMIGYMYCMDRRELSLADIKVHNKNGLISECEEIAELLIYRDKIPSIYKTYQNFRKKFSLSTMRLPQSLVQALGNDESVQISEKNAKKLYKSHQRFPQSDIETTKTNIFNVIEYVPILPPNKCSLHCLRGLILQKQGLLSVGENAFSEMVRLRYDNPINYLQSESSLEKPLIIDQSSIMLCNPKYILLRARMLSILSIPSIIARIPTYSCVLKGDKLHEEQNNTVSSTKISELFSDSNIILQSIEDKNLRKWDKEIKRKYNECNDVDVICRKRSCTSVLKVKQGQHITRRVSHKWLTLLTQKTERTFFVSKDILQNVIKNDFIIESINGVPCEDFLV